MDARTRERVEALARRTVDDAVRVARGYTPAERWVVRFADGASAFAKIGTSVATSGWLREEARAYATLASEHLPAWLGFADDPERPILLLEDLSRARWPPPWEDGDVERVLAALDRIAATRTELPRLERHPGWREVRADPEPFLSTRLASRAWLEAALPALLSADAPIVGGDLVHGDVRSDNLCLLPDRVVLVDWNFARRGPAAWDRASFAPSLRLEGGPLPEDVAPDVDCAVAIAGFFASQAGLPILAHAPRVRWIQHRQLRIALPWVARVLGLERPDGDHAQWEIARATRELEAGRISEEEWYRQHEEALVDAYLASDDPRAQSGKSGDAAEWRWSRELVLDACPRRARVLDVGAANGLLMESLHAWGRERGMAIEPYGLEISHRLARLARRRLPQWADRIAVGNVMAWEPPLRFDVVHTGLDYVPRARRREMVERILRTYLVPGGRIVLRAERADPAVELRAIGLEPSGAIEAVHPSTGAVRRSAWLGG
jgi:hypothetical protein